MLIKKIIPVIVVAACIVVVVLLGNTTETRIIDKAFENLLDSKSFSFNGGLEVSVQAKIKDIVADEELISQEELAVLQGLLENAFFSLGFNGAIDKANSDNTKIQSAINIALNAEGMQFELEGEARYIDDVVYLKINSLPALPLLGDGLSAIKGQWFKVGQEIIDAQNDEVINEETKDQFITDLKNLIKGKELFEIKESIDNGHYLVSPNKETLKEAIPGLLQIIKEYLPEEEQVKYEQDLQEILTVFPEKFDIAWEQSNGMEFDVWVDSKPTLTKIKWQRAIDLTSFVGAQDKIESGIINIDIEFSFSDFNTSVDIETPEDAMPIGDMFLPAVEE